MRGCRWPQQATAAVTAPFDVSKSSPSPLQSLRDEGGMTGRNRDWTISGGRLAARLKWLNCGPVDQLPSSYLALTDSNERMGLRFGALRPLTWHRLGFPTDRPVAKVR